MSRRNIFTIKGMYGTESDMARASATAGTNIDNDAREFGLHLIQGGWRMGLLVARNVVKAPGRVSPETLAPKTNATEFARRAHTTAARVLRYLDAWDRAAAANIVPRATDLTPGQEVLTLNGRAFVLDADMMPAWRTYYNVPRQPAEPVTTRTTRTIAPPPPAPPIEPTPTLDDSPTVVHRVEAAGERFTAERESGYTTAASNGFDSQARNAAALIHRDKTNEIREAIKAAQSYMRRITDLAHDVEWLPGDDRIAVAEEIRVMSRQLVVVADIAADPNVGRVTDAQLSELIDNDA